MVVIRHAAWFDETLSSLEDATARTEEEENTTSKNGRSLTLDSIIIGELLMVVLDRVFSRRPSLCEEVKINKCQGDIAAFLKQLMNWEEPRKLTISFGFDCGSSWPPLGALGRALPSCRLTMLNIELKQLANTNRPKVIQDWSDFVDGLQKNNTITSFRLCQWTKASRAQANDLFRALLLTKEEEGKYEEEQTIATTTTTTTDRTVTQSPTSVTTLSPTCSSSSSNARLIPSNIVKIRLCGRNASDYIEGYDEDEGDDAVKFPLEGFTSLLCEHASTCKLGSLELTCYYLTRTVMEQLTEWCRTSTNIQKLVLRYCDVELTYLVMFASEMAKMKSLERFDVISEYGYDEDESSVDSDDDDEEEDDDDDSDDDDDDDDSDDENQEEEVRAYLDNIDAHGLDDDNDSDMEIQAMILRGDHEVGEDGEEDDDDDDSDSEEESEDDDDESRSGGTVINVITDSIGALEHVGNLKLCALRISLWDEFFQRRPYAKSNAGLDDRVLRFLLSANERPTRYLDVNMRSNNWLDLLIKEGGTGSERSNFTIQYYLLRLNVHIWSFGTTTELSDSGMLVELSDGNSTAELSDNDKT